MNPRNSERLTAGQIMAKHRLRFRSKSASRVSSASRSVSTTDLSGHSSRHSNSPHDERITLNVGGTKFQTRKETLNKIPSSTLCQLVESCKQNEDPEMVYEYYFDRSAVLFEYILNFYRVEELHFGHHLCPSQIKLELEFWKIPERYLSDCCWLSYIQYFDKQRERNNIEKLLAPGVNEGNTVTVGTAVAYVYEPTYIGSVSSLIKDAVNVSTPFH